MKDTLISAKLIAFDQIRVTAFYDVSIGEIKPRLVIQDLGKDVPMHQLRSRATSNLSVIDYKLPEEVELGHAYFVEIPNFGRFPLDVNDAVYFEGFDERYEYDGPLGAIYDKKKTFFGIYAPLASHVALKIRRKGEKDFSIHSLRRVDGGAYVTELNGDYEGAAYYYLVVNGTTFTECTDPYAFGSAANGRYNYVIDLNKLKTRMYEEALPVLHSYSDAIVYEFHVRDMTIHPDTDIAHKGKFLGLTEKGRKTKGGNPAGLDYISSLGITYAQILPMYDYRSVDEYHPDKSYNWGYDPAQYFVPEGSYSTDPDDPYARLLECQQMVSAFHKEGIRVVMDVVYNHVYNFEGSNFEKVVPGYYFRHRPNGRMASTSGCGNDLASERPMVRRLIVESALHWIKYFGVDGFRYDLMGIIDVETLKLVERKAKQLKKDFIVYGEGWDMGGDVRLPLGTMGNYRLLPTHGFFNDRYREAVKGYCFGDESKMPSVLAGLSGSSLDFNLPAMFLSATQSINYVECHDNGTFYDYLRKLRPYLSEEDTLKICVLAVNVVLFSFGVPFLHAGQEIGGTKQGMDNSYNAGDIINRFDYSLLDKNKWMYEEAKKAIAIRKKKRFFHIYDNHLINEFVDIRCEGALVSIHSLEPNLTAPDKKIAVYFNLGSTEYTLPIEEGAYAYDQKGKEVPLPVGEAKVPAYRTLVVVYK